MTAQSGRATAKGCELSILRLNFLKSGHNQLCHDELFL